MYLPLHFPTHAVLSASNVSMTPSKAQNIVEYFSTWHTNKTLQDVMVITVDVPHVFYGVIELTEAGYTLNET